MKVKLTRKRQTNKKPKVVNKKATVKLIKKVINGESETKIIQYFSGTNGLFTNTGTYNTSAYFAHNSSISDNQLDINRLIPFSTLGIETNQRIGKEIKPLSLLLKGNVKLRGQDILNNVPIDRWAVMYILEHVTYKSYVGLGTNNDFNQLLLTGSDVGNPNAANTTNGFGIAPNATVPTGGLVQNYMQPVVKQYYRVLKKRKFRLRYAGASLTTVLPGAPYSVANSHDYQADFSVNLTKYLPKKLKYPEAGGVQSVASGAFDPTNSAIFMCWGGYEVDGTSIHPSTIFEVIYHTTLNYKDI
jgi:hypothetical protein